MQTITSRRVRAARRASIGSQVGYPCTQRSAVIVLLGACLLLGGGCGKKAIKDDDWIREPDTGGPRAITHEVAVGETLTLIADNYYGDPALASKIARQNGLADPDRLEPGSVLQLEFTEQEWLTAQKRAAAMSPYNRGVDLMAHGDLQAAEREFRLALEMAPEFVNARYNLALVLLKRGQLDLADQILNELVLARPGEPDFLFALGHTQFLQTKFTEAATTFRALLSVVPDHRRGTFGLARSLQESGRTQEAVAVWRAYLKLDGTSSWADEARRNIEILQGD